MAHYVTHVPHIARSPFALGPWGMSAAAFLVVGMVVAVWVNIAVAWRGTFSSTDY